METAGRVWLSVLTSAQYLAFALIALIPTEKASASILFKDLGLTITAAVKVYSK